MKRKGLVVSIVLVAVLVFTLACTQVAPGPASPPGTQPAAGPAAAKSADTWQDKWNALIPQAQKEGKVVVYTSANPQTRIGISNGFKDKYGINLEFVTGIGAELITKYLAEYRAGIRQADLIIIGAPDLIGQVKQSGSLEGITPYLILPEVTDDKAWMSGASPVIDKDGQVLGFLAAYSTALLVNTDLVKESELKSYFDLLKPEWKEKILMADPTVFGGTNEWISFMMVKGLGMEKGREYMQALAKQNPMIIRDTRLVVDWVARGKYRLVLGPHRQAVSEIQSAGAPIQWRRTIEGGFIQPSGGSMSLIKDRPDPKATIVFINWLLSKEGQTIFAKNYGVPSARLDVSTEGQDPALVAGPGDKVYAADEEYFIERNRLVPMIKEMFGALVQQ